MKVKQLRATRARWCVTEGEHHRDLMPRRGSEKLWWMRSKQSKCDEPTVGEHFVGYPIEILTVFEEAARRCPFISIDYDVMSGQPCIQGTRIPVRSVLRAIEHYGSIPDAIKCYPYLTVQQVEDALYFSQLLLEPPSGLDETSPIAR